MRHASQAHVSRSALEREILATVAERGAPALAELLGAPDPEELLSGANRMAFAGLRALAIRGEKASPEAVEAELKRAGANGAAGAARAAMEIAIEAYGGSVEPGTTGPLVHALADLLASDRPLAVIPVVCAADVVETPVTWLVPGFLARGELTDLAGDPGVGKGSIVASWAARILRENSEASAIIFQTEDRLGFVRARLRAEGADLERVHLLDIMKPQGAPIFPGDAPALEALVRVQRAALVALDPALEFLDASLDSHKQQDVQRFCASLAGIAQRTGAGVMTVRHLNKAQGVGAIYRAAGSITFIARARMALFASKDKENGQRVLAVTKGNLAKDSTAVTFDIMEREGSTVVAWGEATTTTADELANQDVSPRAGRPAQKVSAAAEMLSALLANGPRKVEDLVKEGRTLGISRRTLFRAKESLRLEVVTLDLKSAWRLARENAAPPVSTGENAS